LPHIALLESGLSFVAVKVDEASKKTADREDYNAINPVGYVSALMLDDGSVLLEAAAIAQNFLSSEMQKGGIGPLFYTALDERTKDLFSRMVEGALRLCRQAPVYARLSVGQGLLKFRRRLVCDDGLDASCWL
jgi:glutathione S-transferase